MSSTPITINGVSVYELHYGSGQGEVDYQGKGSAQRRFLMDWSQRAAFSRAIMGYATVVDGTLVTYQADPHPDKADLLPSHFRWEGSGVSTGANTYSKAIVTVTYETRDIDGQSESRYSESGRATYEMIEIPHETQTSPGGTYGGRSSFIKMPQIEYHLTIHRLPEYPLTRAIALMGSGEMPPCNAAPFKGAAAGHVAFIGPDFARESSLPFTVANQSPLNAQPLWSVTYHFLISSFDLRKRFEPATGEWVDSNHKLSGKPLYTAKDFNQLFPA